MVFSSFSSSFCCSSFSSLFEYFVLPDEFHFQVSMSAPPLHYRWAKVICKSFDVIFFAHVPENFPGYRDGVCV